MTLNHTTSNLMLEEPRGLPVAAVKTQSAARNRQQRRIRKNLTGYLWLLPTVFFFVFFTIVPLVQGILYAFQTVDLNDIEHPVWVGWSNFQYVLTDPYFWNSWRTSMIFTIYGLVFGYLTPVILAIAVSEMRIGAGIFRLFFYLPAFLPPVAGSFLWKWFLNNDGLINSILKFSHLPTFQFFNSTIQALPTMVAVTTWGGFGGGLLFYIAALRGIPTDQYDAAEIDGAGIFQRIWHITLPNLRFIMMLTLITQITGSMQEFNAPFLLTGGAPVHATETVVFKIYSYALVTNDIGSASAFSVMLFAVLAGFSIYYLYMLRGTLGLSKKS